MVIRTDAESIWKELEQGRHYKSSENLYNTIAQNERFKIGDQWKGMVSQNLPQTVYNFIGQVADTQVSSVMSQQVTINRSPDDLSMDDPMIDRAAKIFAKCDKLNWERTKMDALNEDILMDAYVAGMGGSFWYWDEDIITGNTFLTKGDFKGEALDSISLYVSNPNELEIQNQDWIMISTRKSVTQLKEMAKKYGVPEDEIERIGSDDSVSYEGYDKAQNEQDNDATNGNQTTFVVKMYKEKGRVMCVKSTSNVVIKKPYPLELERYPVAIFNWYKRKRFIYGASPVTPIIANQKVANLQASMRHLHAQLLAIPKVLVNKSVISGFTNTIGGINYANLPPGTDVASAIRFIQPTAMSMDVDKSIDDSIERTKNLLGANQNVLGEGNPDNFRAIVAQQKAAGIPLESVKRRFYQYIEDVALIWMDFYKNKYKLARRITVDNEVGESETLDFTGTDFKDLYLQTKIDVGASTQWSELLQIDFMNTAWDKGIIQDPILYLKSMPDNIIPNREELITELEQKMNAQAMGMPGETPGMPPGMPPGAPMPMEQAPPEAMQPAPPPMPQEEPQGSGDELYEMMIQYVEQLPEPQRTKLMAMLEASPDEAEQLILELMKDEGLI